MTAEIALMNRDAVALAADSAVTMTGVSGQKIFASANKLFSLSRHYPIGIMVYGNATFMNVPWETIIKIYRRQLGKKQFNFLSEFAIDFIRFLDNGNPLFPESIQEQTFLESVRGYLAYLREQIRQEIEKQIKQHGKITDMEIKTICQRFVDEDYSDIERTSNIPTIPEEFNEELIEKYDEPVTQAISDIFEKLPISDEYRNKLVKIIAGLFSKFPNRIEKKDISGIVIAGFGANDIFPALKSYILEGIVNGRLKFKERNSVEISFSNNASIIPFAQSEMVATFMEGVDPSYVSFEESYLGQIFNEFARHVAENVEKYSKEEKEQLKNKLELIGKSILDDLRNKLRSHRKDKFAAPVINVVAMLPKDELAAMAESLINLTSFKRKVSLESETVGGPIDVAVISKGDGFIWIKRKHYFKIELNPQFTANYYREDSDEEKNPRKT